MKDESHNATSFFFFACFHNVVHYPICFPKHIVLSLFPNVSHIAGVQSNSQGPSQRCRTTQIIPAQCHISRAGENQTQRFACDSVYMKECGVLSWNSAK